MKLSRPETVLLGALLLAACAPTPEITEQTDETAKAAKETANLTDPNNGQEIYPPDMLWHTCETPLPTNSHVRTPDFRIVHRIPRMKDGNFGTHQCNGHGSALHYLELKEPTTDPALTLRTYTLNKDQTPDDISTYTTEHNTWVAIHQNNVSPYEQVFVDISCPVQDLSRVVTLDLNHSPTHFMVRCNNDGSIQLTTAQFHDFNNFTALLAPPSSSQKAPTIQTANKTFSGPNVDVNLDFEIHKKPVISQDPVNTQEIIDLIEDLDRNSNNSYQSELYIKCLTLLRKVKGQNPNATEQEIADIFYARALKTNLIENLLTLGRDVTSSKLTASVVDPLDKNIVNAHNIDLVTVNGKGANANLSCHEIKGPKTQPPNLADLGQSLFTFRVVVGNPLTAYCSTEGTLNLLPRISSATIILD